MTAGLRLPCLVLASIALSFVPLHAGERDLVHLRPMDVELRRLVQAGVAQSSSFRALVERLGQSDVVVYVQYADLPPNLYGRLTFVSTAGGQRYVMVRLATARIGMREEIATLGHELQHALEVAERPEIVDQATMAREYARFGIQRPSLLSDVLAFDTTAAIAVGERIWREVAGGASAD